MKRLQTLYIRPQVQRMKFFYKLVVNIKGKKTRRKVRVILNTGSQRSYIKKSTAKELGFETQREEEFSHALFGGRKTETQRHNCYKIYLYSLEEKDSYSLDALDQDIICNDIASVRYGPWMRELKRKKIFITDFQNDSGPNEILLGAEVVGKLFTGKREELMSGLVTMGTKLGWTLIGKVSQLLHQNVNMTVVSILSQELPVLFLWDLEPLGIRDPVEQNTKDDLRKAVMIHFRDTVQQNSDGRYEVSLPWEKKIMPFHPINYELTYKRLDSTYKKLDKTGYREKYQQVFEEWIEGVIEEVSCEEMSLQESHYLPHRPVIKETSVVSFLKTSSIVFDASAKIPNYSSLNDCLNTGMNFIQTIPTILVRFRLYEVGVISDIKRAFLQISLNENDRNILRFFSV
ncbi:CCHC-type domain-containing protein [Trichonephila clavata]|uniref:CCHC-type domain-containing protein n=1 Tax=Trichonephila clavata TaxID=2740835 RepID=A0A8X6JZS3_TRICU|nr:CCHC-type domain-containing protein [Trichonephila clavata]